MYIFQCPVLHLLRGSGIIDYRVTKKSVDLLVHVH